MATSPSLVRSASPTGSATRRRRCWRKTSACPNRPSTAFPKKEVYFARGEQPPKKPAAPLGGPKSPPHTHKHRLLANDPIVNNKGGKLWLADSTRFPISKTITGAVLDLDSGAPRELHWRPTADEWQDVLEGKCSLTMFGSGGRYRTKTLEKGDVGYIPQGYGHSIANVGAGKCRVLIGFNSGVYEEIDLSEWIAGNPLDVLATNFGK